jgi:hypothetical protein
LGVAGAIGFASATRLCSYERSPTSNEMSGRGGTMMN